METGSKGPPAGPAAAAERLQQNGTRLTTVLNVRTKASTWGLLTWRSPGGWITVAVEVRHQWLGVQGCREEAARGSKRGTADLPHPWWLDHW